MKIFFSQPPSKSRRRVTQADAEIIPKFRPEQKNSNVVCWLHKIDQLGDIYGWDEIDRQFVMQMRLRGSARDWYEDLEDYRMDWNQWKAALETAFPRSQDFVDCLEAMMARNKTDTETMTKYFHDKISLLRRCNITGEEATSCVIRGLPVEIRANAKAYKCETPQQLYHGFLSSLENYKQVEKNHAKGSTWRRVSTNGGTAIANSTPATPRQQPLVKQCYVCRRRGHEAQECRSRLRCDVCQKQGHVAANCWFAAGGGAGGSSQQGPKVCMVYYTTYNIYLDLYKKNVIVNGCKLTAYIDTGSKLNILTMSQARLLNLPISASNVTMAGFGGAHTRSLGTSQIEVFVDHVVLTGPVEITNYNLAEIDLIVGQTMINQDNISLITTKESVTFVPTNKIDAVLSKIQLVASDYVDSYSVYLKYTVTIPTQSERYIEVYVDPETRNIDALLTRPVYFELGRTAYIMPGVVIKTEEPCVKIINIGTEDIEWAAGRLVARAEPVTIVSTKTTSVMAVDQIDCKEGGLNTSNVNVGELPSAERGRLLRLLNKFKYMFARDTKDLGCTDLIKMHIQTTTDQAVHFKPYRLSQKENQIVNEKVNDLVEAGIVRESESEYASPVVLIKKKGGDYRLCIDYRALNARTVKDRYPLPHIDDQVARLAGKCFFTTLDLAQGYYQVPMAEESIHKTAFVTPSGQFEFLKMPFGLANAPAVFSRLIRMALNKVGEKVAIYLDDVLLPTSTAEEGLNLLEVVLGLLSDANLKLNLNKCSFLQQSVNYLGHEITEGTIRPGQSKIDCVANYRRPRNVHEIRQFIGLTSYFRKFIKGFAEIARPLTQLTKKDVEWVWEHDQEQAFQTLKQRLTERPVLAIYDSTARTELHTDASKLGLSGILLQYQTDGTLRPIAYYSRVTSKEEQFYHSYELETLAVVESLKRFRIYLTGIPVKVVTDCAALRTTLVKRDLIPRIARWWLAIQDFDLEIEYRPGERMRHADALSRNPIPTNVCMIENSDWLLTLQLQDEHIQSIIHQLQDGTDNPDITSNYTVKDGLLYRKALAGELFVIPKSAKWSLMQKYHDQIGHPGFERCEKTVKTQFWFPGMTRFIRKYVNSCLQCAYGKGNHGKLQGELHPIEKVPSPMHTLHVDHLGPFSKTRQGNAYVLVVIDAFTKFVFAKPVRKCSSLETIKQLKEIFSQFGNPHRIITDRGVAFTSRYFKTFAEEAQFRHTLNAIASPRSNGQVERVNRTLLNGLNTMSESECTWDTKLPDIVWGINNTPNGTTGIPPFNLMFSHKNSRLPAYPLGKPESFESQVQALHDRRDTAKLRIDKNMTIMKQRFDRARKKCEKYSVGQLVLWKGGISRDPTARVTKKLNGLYTGPYKIIKAEQGIDRYTIVSIKGMKGYRRFTAVVRGETLRHYKPANSDDDSSSSDHEIDRDDLIDLLES